MRPFEPLEWDELSLSAREAIGSDAGSGAKLAAARAHHATSGLGEDHIMKVVR